MKHYHLMEAIDKTMSEGGLHNFEPSNLKFIKDIHLEETGVEHINAQSQNTGQILIEAPVEPIEETKE